MGMGGLNGTVAIASLAGMFRLENAFTNAVLFMAGPGAIITALTFQGEIKERMIAALLAGIIATIIVMLSAGIGAKILSFLNFDVLKIAGGISVLLIGLIIMGLKINDKLPIAIVVLGILAAAVWRN